MLESLLIVACAPIVLICLFIYNKDNEKEPMKLLIRLILLGVLSCFITLFIDETLAAIFPMFKLEESELTTTQFIIYFMIYVALVEEGSKYLVLYLKSYNHREFDYSFDMIVYGVFTSLGFALFENILYVCSLGFEVGFLRAVTAVPIHACCGAVMGIFLSKSKCAELLKTKGVTSNKVKALVVPVLIHGIYDMSTSILSLGLLIVFVVALVIITVSIINIHDRNDRKIKLKNKFCPKCGNLIYDKFCSNCGNLNE